MTPAFASSLPLSSTSISPSSALYSRTSAPTRTPSRARHVRRAPRASVIAPTVVEAFATHAHAAGAFLTAELKDHLANYVVRFGSQIDDMALIQDVFVSGVHELGLDIDIVTCDAMGCVCLREAVGWMEGDVVESPEDLVPAIRNLSDACGLDTSVLS